MPVEIKELVIKTILDRSTQNNNLSSQEIQIEIKRQLELYKSQIIDNCIEIISEASKKQGER
jgi:hypothetical protein